MKHTKNGAVVIAIDHGYGNIKTANTITPTGITVYDSEPTFAGDVLLYEGRYYRLGEGHKAFISDKVQDIDFYIFTLMGIARELHREGLTEADVYLAVGLPLTWVKSQRDSFKAYLTAKENVCFTFKGTAYRIRIVGCKVYPQGYTAVLDQLGGMTGVNMLADIGNGTMNVMYINDRKPVESKCWTEKLGVEQCVIRVKNAVMDRFGTALDDTHIKSIIMTGSADISDKYLAVIRPVIEGYCTDIFDALRKYEYNPDTMRLYIVGGGSKLIKNFGTYEKDRVTVIPDVRATARGYEYLTAKQIEREQNG